MSGEIPAELGSLANLEWLGLDNNRLTGEIPAELGSLAKLEGLWLGTNRLGGEVPAELGRLSSLRRLDLSANRLSGEIPAGLSNLSNLRRLNLSSNQLIGEIPTELGNLTYLQWLALSNNRLTGSIPAEIGSLADLEYLLLSGNQFVCCMTGTLRSIAQSDIRHINLPFCDVLLSGLTVRPGLLVPGFDPYRTQYFASIGEGPVTVTIAPTNDYDATFLFYDENGNEVADVDAALDGFQVDFRTGIPTIEIQVISRDNRVVHTYTVLDLVSRYDVNKNRVMELDEFNSMIRDFLNFLNIGKRTIQIINNDRRAAFDQLIRIAGHAATVLNTN